MSSRCITDSSWHHWQLMTSLKPHHITFQHVTSPHVTSFHVPSNQCKITSQKSHHYTRYATSLLVTCSYITSRHEHLIHITLYCTSPHWTSSPHVVSHHAPSHHITYGNITLHHITSRRANHSPHYFSMLCKSLLGDFNIMEQESILQLLNVAQ